ncbi:type II toxin-antitoxin system prevent-host-death family antitoxin [Sphingobium sp. LSP13-1-1.1]|uniref:type II toxin-antitoxin system prevent-host-death family antitoxin n=1 Tax=Sphingobium sp. LSP13-1-1.1 TaxID=3135234 RepID=UPI0034221CF1
MRIAYQPIMAKVAPTLEGSMQHMSARDAKNGFGRLIDLARAAPVSIDKYGRPVVVVLSVEEYERLSAQRDKNGTNA